MTASTSPSASASVTKSIAPSIAPSTSAAPARTASLASCPSVGVYTLAGSVPSALFQIAKVGTYFGIAADLNASRTRRLYWNEYSSSPAGGVIRYLDESGGVGVYSGSLSAQGSADGTLATSTFNTIHAMLVDPANGDLYVSDTNANKIRRLRSSGTTTMAGTASAGCTGDGSAATSATLQNVMAMARDPDSGNVNFLVASACHRGRTLTAAGIVNSWVGVTSAGVYAGNNGLATAATFNYPNGLASIRDPSTGATNWYITVSSAGLTTAHFGASPWWILGDQIE